LPSDRSCEIEAEARWLSWIFIFYLLPMIVNLLYDTLPRRYTADRPRCDAKKKKKNQYKKKGKENSSNGDTSSSPVPPPSFPLKYTFPSKISTDFHPSCQCRFVQCLPSFLTQPNHNSNIQPHELYRASHQWCNDSGHKGEFFKCPLFPSSYHTFIATAIKNPTQSIVGPNPS
jgi:hypothetical protein